jgi:hypothetical protein
MKVSVPAFLRWEKTFLSLQFFFFTILFLQFGEQKIILSFFLQEKIFLS